MPFDLESAIDITPDQLAIPTTKFDPATAEEVAPSKKNTYPIAEFLRKIFRNSPLEAIKTQSFLVGKAQEGKIPEPLPNESMAEYTKRFVVETGTQEREKEIAKEGIARQLEVPMTGMIAAAGMAAPIATVANVGAFSLADSFFNGRRILEENLPDTPPLVLELVEILDFGAKAAALGFGTKTVMERMKKINAPKAALLEPKQVEALKNNDVVKETLGIEKEHIDASLNSGTPLQVPVEKLVELSEKPEWTKIKEKLEGGELVEKGKGKEGKQEVLSKAEAPDVGASEPIAKSPLHAEALKYKTAEEFVKAQGDTVYRAGNPFDKSNMTDFGLSVGRERSTAEIFGGKTRGIEELNLNKNAKVLKDIPESIKVDENFDENILNFAKSGGYDVIDISSRGVDELRIINPDVVKTKSQLTAIWNEAHGTGKPPTPPTEPAPLPEGPIERGLSKSVYTQAIKEGLKEDFGDLPTYEKRNMGDVAKRVSEFIETNYEQAKKIALGEEAEVGDLRSQELFTGLRIKALAEGDVNTLRELGTSEKASAIATELGQRVKALDASDVRDPVTMIRDIVKTRTEAVKKRLKKTDLKKEYKKAKEEIKKEIKSVVKKMDWEGFVASLEC